MNDVIVSHGAPCVFGYLYVAVFSNGTVKAGMSKRNPRGRVAIHASAGKCFGIAMDASFFASIYTNDTATRERLMHQEIAALAPATNGREWFKFSDASTAANFASSYLCKIERMSFAERPSIDELAALRELSNKKTNSLLSSIFESKKEPADLRPLPSPATDDELMAIESLLNEYSVSVVGSIADVIMGLEENRAMSCDDMDHGMPLLRAEIDAHLDVQAAVFHEQISMGVPMDVALGQPKSMSRETAIQIIKAAAHYPEFFFKAVSLRGEVKA